jgi:cell division protein FtsZ
MEARLKKHSQEEANRIAEEQEKAAAREERRGRYYGNEAGVRRYKRRPHIYLFRPEDLDNDDVISAVESTPTYKRTREILDSIHSQASGDILVDQKSDAAAEPIQGVISFV